MVVSLGQNGPRTTTWVRSTLVRYQFAGYEADPHGGLPLGTEQFTRKSGVQLLQEPRLMQYVTAGSTG